MKMYERFIPTPVTIEEFADYFERNVGSLGVIDHKKMFCAWIVDKFTLQGLTDFFGHPSHANVYYYIRKHKELVETDEIYRRKFERL